MLITEEMVETMKPGSVIVDLAVEQGGNCPLQRTRRGGRTSWRHHRRPFEHARRIAVDASALYARNLLAFLTPDDRQGDEPLKIDWADEIVKGAALTRDGRMVHPQFTSADPTPLEARPA